jgi:1,4-alpha-glucan branching enzyme
MLKKSGDEATFIFDGESKDHVFLVGDFNKWNKSSTKMTKKGGKWQITLSLKPGKYAYKYLVDNNWINDSAADEYITNPFGQQDSVINVSAPVKVAKTTEKVAAKKAAAPKKAKKTTKK